MDSISNNLFNYATSELSQDAFICYLASFALKGNDHNKYMHKCAIDFINMMLPDNDKMNYGEFLDSSESQEPILKQFKNIDVLIHTKGYSLIIEDKTFTSVHDDQINRYRENLIEQGLDENKIRTVYYKIIEQSGTEEVDFEFNREKLLKLFNKYYNDAKDKIFTDYVDYLKSIDNSVKDFTKSIHEWKREQYIGFFCHLIKENIVKDGYWNVGWGYVPNQSGGFMGLWWSPVLVDNLYSSCKCELYLQIEANRIVLKIYNSELSEDEEHINNARYKFKNELDEYIKENKYNVTRMSSIRITYKTVSLYFLEYNEKNFEEKIKYMEKIFYDIKNKYDKNLKGIIFDTNKTYYPEDEIEMLRQSKVWAKGNPKRYVNSFKKNDFVLYYSKGNGIIAIGKIKDDIIESIDNGNGLSRNVEILVPSKQFDKNNIARISASELKEVLEKGFFFASTMKTPFLTNYEVNKLINLLKSKYKE